MCALESAEGRRHRAQVAKGWGQSQWTYAFLVCCKPRPYQQQGKRTMTSEQYDTIQTRNINVGAQRLQLLLEVRGVFAT